MAQLDVDRGELSEGLRRLARHVKLARAGEAILRLEDGRLVIQAGGGEISAAATGRWPGEARVSGAFVLAIAKHLPSSDPVPLRVEAGRFFVAGTSILCQWQKTGAAQVEIPIGAPLSEIIRIGMEYTDEALKQSGILERVEEARARRELLVERAAATLEPLGVRAEDVVRFVNDCIRLGSSRPPQATQ
jgi:hypothetical protein